MQTQSNRNAYFRLRYALNIEKERQRQREKYHRNKKLYSDLTEEERLEKKRKNRIYYEKCLIRQGKKVRPWNSKIELEKPQKEKIEKEKSKAPMKNFRLPERIKHKYVSDVLRKFPKSRLCDVLISDWKISELTEFEELEKLLTEKQ